MLTRQFCSLLQGRKKLNLIRFSSLECYSASFTSRVVALCVRPRLFRTTMIAAISPNATTPSEPTSKPANRNRCGSSLVESFDEGTSKTGEKIRKYYYKEVTQVRVKIRRLMWVSLLARFFIEYYRIIPL